MLVHKCTSVHHAVVAEEMGYDAVTVFGSEGGGHIGDAGLTFLSMVPRAVDLLEIPVIAAGGIADGRGLAAALALGAQGVLIGTRLLLSEEMPHPPETQAQHARGVRDGHGDRAGDGPQQPAGVEEPGGGEGGGARGGGRSPLRRSSRWWPDRLPAACSRRGDPDEGIIVCSQDIGIIHEIKPVSEIVSGMVREAEGVAELLAAGDLTAR